MDSHAYRNLNNPKLVHILTRLNQTYLTGKGEDIDVKSPLTVEHLLPQTWTTADWKLPDGSIGLTPIELHTVSPDDSRVQPSRARHAALQTIGNLTILSQPLNSAVSNGPWKVKKPEILVQSLLPINQQTLRTPTNRDGVEITPDTWNEERIRLRGEELFSRALRLWPYGVRI